ncbi:M23 family metallopeptidase [Paraburkholderia unamae]|uniref:Murein DD-endopeptidase MepM/ murein hydrolase activator NlpD n=1 Tax=Paraburkholderia unamae TaxID=219649 RepID=A0ABX5KH14_9BURK|nr:M23 family metallopeptidase [Paraburkholderia unamae]PVX78954.1 murein DD-endopeptidase MepM/ murein hydrolase activator NlpD [Paraburkholderia unamae]CAG9272886.1 LysM domain-containing protein [Paraburkholderia unamae]
MRGLHQEAARLARGAALALAFAVALSACTITPWRSAETGETDQAEDGAVTARAVQPPAVAAAALPASGSAAEAAPGFYRVKPGDTLTRIAKANGQKPATLINWNKLPADGKIQIGQLLRVAPSAAVAAASSPGAPLPPILPLSSGSSGSSVPPVAGAATAPAATPATVVSPGAPKAVAAKPAAKPAAATAAERPSARFIWPIEGSVAQPFKGKSKGVVIAGPAGQQVKAAAAGRVVYAGSGMKAYGKLVIVRHDAHLLTAYGRNGKLLVKEGETVKQGQAIATSGTDGAGISTLMFEVRENGKPVDPLASLPKAQQ